MVGNSNRDSEFSSENMSDSFLTESTVKVVGAEHTGRGGAAVRGVQGVQGVWLEAARELRTEAKEQSAEGYVKEQRGASLPWRSSSRPRSRRQSS